MNITEYDDYFQYYEENFSGTWKKYFDTGVDTGLYHQDRTLCIQRYNFKNYLKILKSYKFIIYTDLIKNILTFIQMWSRKQILIPKGEDYFGI